MNLLFVSVKVDVLLVVGEINVLSDDRPDTFAHAEIVVFGRNFAVVCGVVTKVDHRFDLAVSHQRRGRSVILGPNNCAVLVVKSRRSVNTANPAVDVPVIKHLFNFNYYF